eukprot:11875841-Heterocapsa_arctica.AAC.1
MYRTARSEHAQIPQIVAVQSPLTPFSRRCGKNAKRFTNHPVAIARGLPDSPVPLDPICPYCSNVKKY